MENNMMMDWEKEMVKEIASTIKDEIDKEKRIVISRPRVIVSDLSYELKRKARIKEEEIKYRRKHTLDILQKCGLDLNEFMNSSLYNSPRTDLMLEFIQGKIDGYDLSLTSKSKKNGIVLNVRERRPNNHPIDINRLFCTFENETLILESDGIRYEYSKDEHSLIYLNGKVIITDCGVMTKEEEYESLRDFMDDMKSDRLQNERREEKAKQYAKTWWVEE